MHVEEVGVVKSPRIHHADNRDERTATVSDGIFNPGRRLRKHVLAHKRLVAPAMMRPNSDRRRTLVPGGLPLFSDGRIVGAIGVGGGTKEQDMEIARYVAALFRD